MRRFSHFGTTSLFTSALLCASLGCSKIQEKLGEKAAEALLESQTGNKVDIQTNDGKLAVKVTDDKGTTMTLAASDKLPDDFPKSVPIYPGAKVQATLAGKSETKEGGFMVTLSSPDPTANVGAFYKDASTKGRKQILEMTTPGGQTASWQTADGYHVTAVVSRDASNQTVIVLHGARDNKSPKQ